MKKLGFLACGLGLLMAFSCTKSDNVYDTFHVVKSSADKNMSLNLESVQLDTVHCSGEIVGMKVAGYPSMYKKDPYKFSSFQCINFDISAEENLYVNFEADSLIYVFDKDMKPQFAFGTAGKNMDRDYLSVSSWEQMPVYQTNRETKGYYSWVEYIDETGMCFRSYRKGVDSTVDGLQIYDRKGNLLGDVDVPKTFKVTGYAAPYYYSQVFDGEDDGSLTIFRFKLD